MTFNDTVCAPATSVGSGAISLIRVSGPDALRLASSLIRLRRGSVIDAEGYSLHYGTACSSAGKFIDDVMVSVFRAPHSYTGEDSVEIACHASEFIVSVICSELCDAGARMALPGEFTRRAYLNGKMDLVQAEAVADMIAAESEVQHALASSQLKGAFSAELRELRDKLVELSALMELELDFSEEDVEFADRDRLRALLDSATSHISILIKSFQDGNAVRNGVPVAIVGAPNSGKSTLLNALLGDDRAIVSDIPGTTRDTVEETMTLGGTKYRFIDTAGLRKTSDAVEKIGVERSLDAVRKARLVIYVADATKPADASCPVSVPSDAGWEEPAGGVPPFVAGKTGAGPDVSGDGSICDEFKPSQVGENIRSLLAEGQKMIVVWNKADLLHLPCPADDSLLISAKTGFGLDKLKKCIIESFPVRENHTMVSNIRHYDALKRALKSLTSVQLGLGCNPSDRGSTNSALCDNGTPDETGKSSVCAPLPTELLCEHLRDAISELNSIFGEQIGTEEVLGEIFGRFCIGK